MFNAPPSEPAVDASTQGECLDAGLAAAFGPESWPLSVARADVQPAQRASLFGGPGVKLRDPLNEPEPPLHRPRSDAMPGEKDLSCRYQLHGEIARGGMGAVLKGHDIDLGREVAVKILLENHRGKTELLQRFIEEAQIAGQLQHPGIVPVYEMGELPDHRPYFSMKLIKGKTLAKLVEARSDSLQDRPRFLKIFEQVCQTLAYAHARGVIHRDLKPSNIMVGAFGEVQVMDWGLAKVLAQGGVHDEESSRHRAKDRTSIVRTRRSSGQDGSGSVGSVGTQTHIGSVMGTPAYMSPEQALGEIDRLDTRSDVFGLGAILCEILTGQPPYVANNKFSLVQKASEADLADAFSRLDACGADAELIDLAKRCLAPERDDRPADADVLAKQLTRYLESVDARLRQAELAGAEARAKAVEERKRRKVQLAFATVLLLFITSLAVGGLWFQQDQASKRAATAELNKEVEGLLSSAREHMQANRWSEAKALLEKAAGRQANGGSKALLQEIEQARKDLDLIAELEEIRLRQSAIRNGQFDTDSADPLYSSAFRDYGLDFDRMEPKVIADHIGSSPIRESLLAAIYNWPDVDPKKHRVRQLVLSLADDNPWRTQFRKAVDRKETNDLGKLARATDTMAQPAAILSLLGKHLEPKLPEEAIALYRQAQKLHPGDFWLNHQLGSALLNKAQLEEAVRYLTAAVALRPKSAGTHLALGNALRNKGDAVGALAENKAAVDCDPTYAFAYNNYGVTQRETGDLDGAMASYRKAIELDPKHVRAHNNLAVAYRDKGDLEDALRECRRTLELAPTFATAYVTLGLICRAQDDLSGAIEAFSKALEIDKKADFAYYHLGTAWLDNGDSKKAIESLGRAVEIDPRDAKSHNNLGVALRKEGRTDDAISCYRKAVEIDPNYGVALSNLGYALEDKKDFDGALSAFRKAVEVTPGRSVVFTDLGNALIDKGDLDGAILNFQTAHTLNPKDAKTLYNLGNALRDRGDLEEAAKAFLKASDLDPQFAEAFCNLARVLQKLGRFGEALPYMERGHEIGSARRNWPNPSAQWLSKLRRLVHCEQILPSFRNGDYEPANNRERFDLAEVCMAKKLPHTAAQLFAEGFEADPKQATELRTGFRYNAACAALLAAAGQGEDCSDLDSAERSRLRAQALSWLQADLSARAKQLSSNQPAERSTAIGKLKFWLKDDDLISVRDKAALAKLPAEEQAPWRKLWDEVETLLKKAGG